MRMRKAESLVAKEWKLKITRGNVKLVTKADNRSQGSSIADLIIALRI